LVSSTLPQFGVRGNPALPEILPPKADIRPNWNAPSNMAKISTVRPYLSTGAACSIAVSPPISAKFEFPSFSRKARNVRAASDSFFLSDAQRTNYAQAGSP
jgi:hypothetical protein